VHIDADAGFAGRHPYLVWGGLLLLASLVLAYFIPAARVLPGSLTVTTAPLWDRLIDYVTLHCYDFFMAIRSFFLLHFLIPFRNALQWYPFPAMLASVTLGAWYLGGVRLVLPVAGMTLFPALTGFWEPAMITLYMIGTAVLLCVIIGFPIGVVASRHDSLSKPLMVACDTLQTFPSFIYLIPVIMVFKVGDVAAITAVIIYAVVPIIRYTNLGLRRVPEEVVEAARTMGCTNWQLLWKVQIPVAMPEIMLGLNQTVMMGLFMVAITALIGTQDLGQEINRALSAADPGRALVAGLCVAAIGLITDRFINTWAQRRKQQLGLA
jgi:glycine betaine/proline transport system permease protein